MIRAFRICKTRFLPSAMSGEGARLVGGRWNSPGQPVVYAASSLSLATLEVMVHLEEADVFYQLFSWISLEFPKEIVETPDIATLPTGWRSDETSPAARTVGDEWLRSMRSAVLAVPSVVMEGEMNYLLNPRHPDFQLVHVSPPQKFRPDARLWKM